MFGLLNDAEVQNSIDPENYARRRGRFYLIWNASKISGRPALVALMAGKAAHDTESTDTKTLLSEIDSRLRKVFSKKIPAPLEVIVTRWKRDPFTRGTYSYVGPKTRPEDYDTMAQSVGNLHFAGEATCGTHPATVHGAFLSGLRVAAEVMDSMAGPISLPMPLVGPAPVKQEMPTRYPMPAAPAPQPLASWGSINVAADDGLPGLPLDAKIKQEPDTIVLASVPPFTPASTYQAPKKLSGPPRQSVCAGDASFWVQPSFDGGDLDYEAGIIGSILSQIGDRPVKPNRPGVNPFLLFTKAKWDECKAHCGQAGNTAGRDAIRTTLGKWWKAANAEEKQPYIDQSQAAQESADAARKEWAERSAQWDIDAKRIREEYIKENPAPQGGGSGAASSAMGGLGVSKRKTNVSNCVVLDHT
jgi:lysine-specific histone demethylase 1